MSYAPTIVRSSTARKSGEMRLKNWTPDCRALVYDQIMRVRLVSRKDHVGPGLPSSR
jgi:hypothetical protein